MSLVTTSVTPEIRQTPFTGLSELTRERSAIARGETIYFKNDIWADAGSGNNRGLIFTFDLDRSYAYVLTDMSCAFLRSDSTINGMEATGLLELGIPSVGGTEYIYSQLLSHASRESGTPATAVGDIPAYHYNNMYPTGTNVGSMCFLLQDRPSYVLYPWNQDGTDSVSVSVMFGEEVQNYPAISYRFAAKFLQYDITQAYDYRINSPLMVRS
jgi:hypothetical protein